jgi:hypothetical protein
MSEITGMLGFARNSGGLMGYVSFVQKGPSSLYSRLIETRLNVSAVVLNQPALLFKC